MKKVIALALAAMMILAVTACGGSASSTAPAASSAPAQSSTATVAPADRLAEIQQRGVIQIATEPYFAPYEFIDPTKTGDEQIVGFDIEIAKKVAEKIGVELDLVPLDFTAVLTGVAEGKYDLAISAIAYSPTRAEAMRLSNVYRSDNTGYGYLVRAEDVDKYTTLESAKDAVIITQSGSVQEGLYNDQIGSCKEFKLVANMTDGFLAVAEGKADICICDKGSADLYAEANGGLATTSFTFEIDPNMDGTVAAAPMEDTESLIELVNEVIEELKADGSIEKWYGEYEEYAKSLGV